MITSGGELRTREVVRVWFPLALSWMFMALEAPIANFFIARMPDPALCFAVFGAIVIPVASLIEAPVLMFLSASTALSRNLPQFLALRRFMHVFSALLTVVHLLVTFTSLFDLVMFKVLGIPERYGPQTFWGMVAITPMTWAVGYRRFHQGALIAAGHSRLISVGTLLRIATTASIASLGVLFDSGYGAVVASVAISCSLLVEAAFSGYMSYRYAYPQLVESTPGVAGTKNALLGQKELFWYFLPLAATSLLWMLASPLGSAALSRMPRALETLAVLPLVTAVSLLCRTGVIANNEVIVALYSRPNGPAVLSRFVFITGLTSSLLLLCFAETPLGELWFSGLFGLSDTQTAIAYASLLYVIPLGLLSAVFSWYYGILILERQTRAVNESVAWFILVAGATLMSGVYMQSGRSLQVTMAAFTLAQLASVLWVRRCVRKLQRGTADAVHVTADGGSAANETEAAVRPA